MSHLTHKFISRSQDVLHCCFHFLGMWYRCVVVLTVINLCSRLFHASHLTNETRHSLFCHLFTSPSPLEPLSPFLCAPPSLQDFWQVWGVCQAAWVCVCVYKRDLADLLKTSRPLFCPFLLLSQSSWVVRVIIRQSSQTRSSGQTMH